MSPNVELIVQFAPPFITLVALIPYLAIYAFKKKNIKPQPENHHLLVVYLICLLLGACVVVVFKGGQLMSVDNSDRSLFICSILIIACIDQCLSLMPLKTKLHFDLAGLLLYSIILLCAVPLIWQMSVHFVPAQMCSGTSMRVIEIGLMLVMVALCMSSGFIKKAKHKDV